MRPRYLVFLVPALLLLYPLSFGPAGWLFSTGRLSGDTLVAVYKPFLTVGWLSKTMHPYWNLWLPRSPTIHFEFPTISAAPAKRVRSVVTEEEVRKFIVLGTSREAIIQRFGVPISVEKNPIFEDHGNAIDEILTYIDLTPPSYGRKPSNFGGFEVRLKNGRVVSWSVIQRG